MWWITGVPIWHECFLLYLIPLWRCFGSCVHKVFPHLSHSKTCPNRVCRTSASHWGWPCFWSTYLTSWSNGVPMKFDTILLNWSTLTVRSRRMIELNWPRASWYCTKSPAKLAETWQLWNSSFITGFFLYIWVANHMGAPFRSFGSGSKIMVPFFWDCWHVIWRLFCDC